ncbi:MAG TPA: STAS domain-containing protein [Solirubrobacteraceae bacterium]|nr:STAS domain-containing protein [Solirubrobacteraceae bacterium]
MIHLVSATRFVRRRRANRPRPTAGVCTQSFAWLAAATGVHLSVSTDDRRQDVSVEGELDSASADIIEHVLAHVFQRPPARVELDLRRVSFTDRAAEEMIIRARAQASTQHVRFRVIRSRWPEHACDTSRRTRRR